MTDDKLCVVLLCTDLMMSSTVSGVASSCDCSFRKVGTIEEVSALAEDAKGVLLFIDLATPGLNVAEMAAHVPAEVLRSAVAYGPHVHAARLQAARDAGVGQVVSRGQFSSQVGQIVAAFAAGV